MVNDSGGIQVVCRHCRRPVKFKGELHGVAYFEGCPRHPNNRRPGLRGKPPFTVPHSAAAVGDFGVDVSTLRAPRRGPLAV